MGTLDQRKVEKCNEELPVLYNHSKTNPILRGQLYYLYHHYSTDVKEVTKFSYTKFLINSALILLIYIHTQLPPPGGISSNCLRNDQDYYVDLTTLLIKSQMIGITYLCTLGYLAML